MWRRGRSDEAYGEHMQGRIQDFKLEGAHLKKLRRAEGGANIFGVFPVKNHDFTPKKSFFFQFSIFTPDTSDLNVLNIYAVISKVMTFSEKRIACSKQSNLGTFSLVGT